MMLPVNFHDFSNPDPRTNNHNQNYSMDNCRSVFTYVCICVPIDASRPNHIKFGKVHSQTGGKLVVKNVTKLGGRTRR